MPKKTTTEISLPKLPREASIVLTIKTQEDLTEATRILSVLNKTLDYLTEQKELLTKPLNATLKEIRARYKEPETILETKIADIRQLMIEYQTKQVALQQAKEAKIAESLAKGNISIEKATDKIAKLPEIVTSAQSDEGSIKFKPVKKFEVVSLADLPIEYHMADESKVRSSMNGGVELPGVRYWVEQVPYNSR